MPLAIAACGGKGSKKDETPDAQSGDLSAQQLVPDLSSAGFEKVEELRPPLQAPGQDNYRAAYRSTESGGMAVVDVNVLDDVELAKTVFKTSAEALKNPPPDFVGGAEGWRDTGSPQIGDERKAYTTTNSDPQGNRAWSDIYRFGRVVVITQLLAPGDNDQLGMRQEIAERVLATME